MRQLVDLFGFLSVVLRAGTLVFQSLLLGGIVFVLWTSRGVPGNPESIQRVQSGSWTLLRFSTIGLIVMQVLYLYVNSAVLMTTAEIGFRAVIGANFFLSGSIVLVAAVATYAVARQQWKFARWLVPVLAMTVLGASVMTNHAASRLDDRPLLIVLTTIHEAATAVWIGGLPFLVLALFRDKDEAARWHITERFSRVALICVGAIVFSGLGMSMRYIASWGAVLGTAYGVMVTAKVLMLGALMLLGGINFWLLRSTSKDRVMPRLRRLIEVEVGIGITVILTAASLTSQPPAVDQPNETVSFHQIVQRMKPTLPRFTYPRLADASLSEQAAADRRQQAAGCLQRRRRTALASEERMGDGVGVEPSLDGTGRARHGIAGAAGPHRQSAVGGILAAVVDRHRHFHLRTGRYRMLAGWLQGLLGVLDQSRGVSTPAGRAGHALPLRCLN